MSEPPPKPAHRPVRKPKDTQPEDADEFDFDVAQRPIEQSQAPQQQLSRGVETEPVDSPAQEPSHAPQAESSAAVPEAPPRPPQRPQSRPSRPIRIQPAPADPPHVRQESDLKAELEALDQPGALDDEATVERFKQVKQKLDEEGPGGPTATQLGFPALGPQKVPQSEVPPPKPLTRPSRRYKSPSPNEERAAHGTKAETETHKGADVPAKDDEAEEGARQPGSRMDSEKETAEEGSSSNNQLVAEDRAEAHSVEKSTSEEDTAAKHDEGHDEAIEGLSKSQQAAKDDQLESEGERGAQDESPAKADNDTIALEESKDTKDIPDAAESSLESKSPAKASLNKVSSESEPQESSFGSPDKSDASEEFSTKEGLATHVSTNSAKERSPSENATDLNSSKFADPVVQAPEESSGTNSETSKAHPSLSKENVHGVDVSKLTSTPSSDIDADSSFAEPAAEAPENPSARGKKHVEFDDIAAQIRSDDEGKDEAARSDSASEIPPTKHVASLETNRDDPYSSGKMVEPKAHQPSQGSESEFNSKDISSEKESSEDTSKNQLDDLSSKSPKDSIEQPLNKPENKGAAEDHSIVQKDSEAPIRDSKSSQEPEIVPRKSGLEDLSEPTQETIGSSNSEASKHEQDSSDINKVTEGRSGTIGDSGRRTSEPVDPKDVAGKPPRPQHRPELKPKPVPKPKPKNALASRFEAALRESEASKPKPAPKPKPREGSSNRVSAIQASMFANLNEALSRGPPPGGRPRFGSSDSQEHASQHTDENPSRADQKVDVNESAEAQIQAMPKNPRARAAGPRRAKRLPESAKPKFSIVVGNEPLWQLSADEQEPENTALRHDIAEKQGLEESSESAKSRKSSDIAQRDVVPDSDHKALSTHSPTSKEENNEPSHSADSGQKTKEPVARGDTTKERRVDLDKKFEDELYSEPTVETRWIPDSVTQAVPSQKPNDANDSVASNDAPEEGATHEASSSRTSMDSNRSDQRVPDLGFNTEIDLRNALERHLSHDSSATPSDSQSNSSSHYSVKVEDLPPLGSLVDRVPSPPAVDGTSRASMNSLMTPQRPKPQTSVSSLGVKTLSQYLDKSPQAGAAPSGWDRMPASSKLDLGEAEGLLKDVSEMKEQHSQLNSKGTEGVDSATEPEEDREDQK